MISSKKKIFVIGLALILCTRIFDFSNIFLFVGILLVFDGLFGINKKEIKNQEK